MSFWTLYFEKETSFPIPLFFILILFAFYPIFFSSSFCQKGQPGRQEIIWVGAFVWPEYLELSIHLISDARFEEKSGMFLVDQCKRWYARRWWTSLKYAHVVALTSLNTWTAAGAEGSHSQPPRKNSQILPQLWQSHNNAVGGIIVKFHWWL